MTYKYCKLIIIILIILCNVSTYLNRYLIIVVLDSVNLFDQFGKI